MDDFNKSFGHELDFASGYFTVFARDLENPNNPESPYLHISSDCPEDIRERLLETWETVKEDTIKRHEEGRYSSLDYFV